MKMKLTSVSLCSTLFLLLPVLGFSQFTHKIKADSVRIYNDNCTAELIVENSTSNIKGFLFNKGLGRTEFRKAVIKLSDSSFLIGGDTLTIKPVFNGLLSGSVLFYDGTEINEDNANFYWDNINKRLGIGTNAPQFRLDMPAYSTSAPQIRTGSLEFQSYSLNNTWFGDNAYYDGSGFRFRNNGHAGLFYFAGKEGQFRFMENGVGGTLWPSATGGADNNGNTQLKIHANGTVALGGSMTYVQGDFTNAGMIVKPNAVLIGTTSDDSVNKLQVNGYIRTSGYRTPSGTSTQFLKADGTVDNATYLTASSLAGYLPLTGGTLTGALGGTSSTFSSNNTTLNINTTSRVIDVTGKNHYYAVAIAGGSATGQSYGQVITAGTNSSDVAFDVWNRSETINYFQVRGDGVSTFRPITSGSSSTAAINLSGYYAGHYSGARIGNSWLVSRGNNTDVYWSGNTDLYTAMTTGRSSYWDQNDGSTRFVNAASVSAGTTPSFVARFIINADGNLGLGTLNPAANLQIAASAPEFALQATGSITNGLRGGISWYNSSISTVANIRAEAAGDNVGTHLDFYTRPIAGSLTQVGRITSSGRWLLGTTSDDGSSIGQFNGQILVGNSSTRGLVKVIGTNGASPYTWYIDNQTGGNEWLSGVGVVTPGNYEVYNQTTASLRFSIAKTTGAATFSSSVIAKNLRLDEVPANGSGRIELFSNGTRFGFMGTGQWAFGDETTNFGFGAETGRGFIFAVNGTSSPAFKIQPDGLLNYSKVAGSGNRILATNNSGEIIALTIGSNLSLSGSTLSATGGSSGTVTGTGASGTIPVWNSASDIGNSQITQSGGTVNINGIVQTTIAHATTGYQFKWNNLNRGGIYALSTWTGAGTDYSTVIATETGHALYFYVDGGATKGFNLSTSGAATFSSSITASNRTRVYGGGIMDLSSVGNDIGIAFGPDAILPSDGNGSLTGKNFGSATTRWSTIYATTGNFSSSLTASSFSGAGTGLTGTANGLNIGGTSMGVGTISLGNATSNVNYGYTAVLRNESGTGGNIQYAPILNMSTGDTQWQLTGDYHSSTSLRWRAGYNGTWYAWREILHDNNFNSYAPSLTGTGASGTWGINISGNAASANAWNSYNQSLITSGMIYMMTYNGSGWGYSSAGTVQAFLGLGTAAYLNSNDVVYGNSSNGTNYITDANAIFKAGFYSFFNGTNVPGGDFGMISIPGFAANNSTNRYNLQIGANIHGSPKYRTTSIDGSGTWYDLLTSQNYNSFAMAGAGYSANQNLNTTSNVTFNQGTFTNGAFDSDERLKNIINRQLKTNISDKVNVMSYTWKDRNKGEGVQYGYSAQELKKIIPEAVIVTQNNTYAVNYNMVHSVLIDENTKRIQHLEKTIEELKETIEKLKNK